MHHQLWESHYILCTYMCAVIICTKKLNCKRGCSLQKSKASVMKVVKLKVAPISYLWYHIFFILASTCQLFCKIIKWQAIGLYCIPAWLYLCLSYRQLCNRNGLPAAKVSAAKVSEMNIPQWKLSNCKLCFK